MTAEKQRGDEHEQEKPNAAAAPQEPAAAASIRDTKAPGEQRHGRRENEKLSHAHMRSKHRSRFNQLERWC